MLALLLLNYGVWLMACASISGYFIEQLNPPITFHLNITLHKPSITISFLEPMGKKWFTAVKRAFSPHKSSTKTQDDNNKREKKRWLFRKSSTPHHVQHDITTQVKVKSSSNDTPQPVNLAAQEENHAILMAVTTAHAAADIIRLTARPPSVSVNHHFAATLIQTSFRGYLARRASKALKGIVMLQAVIRGQNVRKQAVVTLRCMQALLRVQSRVHDQRSRLSHDGRRRSTMSENDSFCEYKYLQDIRRRKSMSRDGTCIPYDWSDRPHNLEELDAKLHGRKIANRNLSAMDEKEQEETASWLDQWIRAKQWENQRTSSKASFDRRDSIKTIEIDSSRPSSRSGVHKPPIPNSPSRRSTYSPSPGQEPTTPSPVKTSASPRCLKEERSYLNANIQSLRLTPRVMGSVCRYSTCANDMTVPNYMAATESAKARIRSHSTPRQRPSTPEREQVGSAKKRLAYPVSDPCDSRCDNYNYCDYGYNLRSSSFKSVQVGYVGMGQQWCSADSTKNHCLKNITNIYRARF